YLKKFPVDWLKIDRSFIRDNLFDAEDMAIVEAIVQLAKGLRLKLIVEGVEEADQMTLLNQLGCEIVQGYLFSPPLPADGVQVFLNQNSEVLVKRGLNDD
ncbi:MAG: EAL domain-containing protein, partial [Thermicanus sp.]|nr:EAL domain-containing protein [Thermicanus sp.]